MTISINLDRVSPHAEVVTVSESTLVPELSGKRFISFRDGDFTLILEGFDADAVAHARAIAKALTRGADELEASLPEPVAEQIEAANQEIG